MTVWGFLLQLPQHPILLFTEIPIGADPLHLLGRLPYRFDNPIAMPYIPLQVMNDILLQHQQLVLLLKLLLDELQAVLIRKRLAAFALVELLGRVQSASAMPDVQPDFAELTHKLVLAGGLTHIVVLVAAFVAAFDLH